MLATINSATTIGIDAHIVHVETNLAFGLPKFSLVGLPDRAINESENRVEAALKNSLKSFPRGRITINLAPADLPKEGSAFDLPIAIGLLVASGQIREVDYSKLIFLGELALDGSLRPVKGILPITIAARKAGYSGIVLPIKNAAEAAVVDGIKVYGFETLNEVCSWLHAPSDTYEIKIDIQELFNKKPTNRMADFSDVRGQENVKRALEVAAAGGHNAVLVGPAGSGKTMLARRIPSILPPLSLEEALETTKIHSVSGTITSKTSLITTRPFRAPHHTISHIGLTGGGSNPIPGELSLAHNGILFLDELPEFQRMAVEVMRQPLEDGEITISRAKMSVTYPSKVMLIASMNPSPGGDWIDPENSSTTDRIQMQRYLSKISGPMLDRIDLHIEVRKVPYNELMSYSSGESSDTIRSRVTKARESQSERFSGYSGIYTNAQMHSQLVRTICKLDSAGSALLAKAMDVLGLSARAHDRILKVARTIADLEESDTLKAHHVAEAVQYRNLDREGWMG
jgi:magnesium chelatase family protein